MSIFPFFLLQFAMVKSNYQMIVTWGRPTNATGGVTPPTLLSSWSDCVSYCYNDLYCVLVHGTLNWCNVYYYNMVFEVEELDSDMELMVAMKMSSASDSCSLTPFENSEVTFKDPNYQYTNFAYSIKYSDSSWKLSYTTTRTCPPDWKLFARPLAQVCLRLYGGVTATWIQSEAVALCADQNATLAGLENDEERLWATNEAVKINAKDNKGGAGFWISGYRRSSCSTLAQVATIDCYQTEAFEFDDKYLSTYGGYIWAPNNPDGVNATGATQNCVMLWTQSQTDKKVLNGTVDDNTCDYRTGSYFNLRGYFCAKVAGV